MFWLLLVLVFFSVADSRAAEEFRAGFAQVDITPEKPMPMWGYGARHALLSRGTLDPLLAKAVVLQAGDKRLAIVGLDLGRSPGEPHLSRIRAAVEQQAEIDFVMISGSHTHHGPVLELKDVPGQGKGKFDDAVAYPMQLEEKLIRVICEAADNLQEARIGWTSRQVDMNRNRHARQEPKPRDKELSVIRLDDLSGRPLAVIVNFAAHPTVLAGSDLRWSADYPGAMMRTVEETLQTHCIFMQGAAGDLSLKTEPEDNLPDDDPRLQDDARDSEQAALIQKTLKLSDSEVRKLQRDMIASAYRMQSAGHRLGTEVIQLATSCQTSVPAAPSLHGSYDSFEFDARLDLHNPAIKTMFILAFFSELAHAAAADYPDGKIRPLLTTVLINDDLALVGGSGEFFASHALRLKERSYAAKTLFFGYCNGHHMYFPTIEAAAQGGYGADPQVSWVEVGAGEQMMNQALIHVFRWRGLLEKGLGTRQEGPER